MAVDEISNPERARQYFGVDLTREDILPVMIVFTNQGDNAFLVRPSDVLLLEEDAINDPIPLQRVEKFAKGGLELAMQETVVPAHGNYRGILFYKVRKASTGLVGKVERILLDRLKMTVIVTEKNSGERIRFAPFTLSGARE